MKRITFVLALLMLCLPQLSEAQTIRVTGTVSSAAEKYPLEGAGVMVKGTRNGVATDYNGQYVIQAGKNAVLQISSVGFKSIEVPVNGRTVINVELEETSESLEAAVVVGYGSEKKLSSVVGSVSTVKATNLQNKPVINVGDALQGQVAGLQVFSSSGDPTASVSMRLRGVNSINASNTPLFILDGSPVGTNVFHLVNQNDIESITVLKDASATAIYGSRAANGVVYITTRKGGGEQPEVMLGYQFSISNIAQEPEKMMNSEEWFEYNELNNPSLLTNASWQSMKDFRLKNHIGGGWKYYYMKKNAPTHKADFSVSGRTNKTDYFISANALRQEAIYRFNSVNRYGMRFNINTKVNDWFKFGMNTALNYRLNKTAGWSSGTRNVENGVIWGSFMHSPYTTPRDILTDDNGNFIGYAEGYPDYIKDSEWWGWRYLNSIQPSKASYVSINGNLYEQITPIKGLTIKFDQALEGQDYKYVETWLPEKHEIFSSDGSAGESHSFSRNYRLTTANTIEYKFQVAQKHNIDVLVGQESFIYNSEGFTAQAMGTTDPRMTTMANGTDYKKPGYSYTQDKMNSLFSRLDYDYDNKYFFNASLRRDGSSLFGANKRYANFWAIGAMYNIKKEEFLKNVNWLDALKLKVSYGTTGNSGIDSYLSVGTIGNGTIYDGIASLVFNGPTNLDLTWETVKKFNIGAEFRLFDKVTANFEYYRNKTEDLLNDIPFSLSTGFSSGWGNVADMKNTGFDATVTVDVVRNKNVFFAVTANVAYTKNKITKLFAGRDEFVQGNTGMKMQVGHPYGEFFQVKYAGVDPANGKQLWYDKEGNITDTYSADNAVFLDKTRYAPWSAGLTLDFTYKQFSAQANFVGMFDKYTFNNDRYVQENANDAADQNVAQRLFKGTWRTPGQITTFPKAGEELQLDDRWLENASFVRLKSLTLSYSLGKRALHALRVVKGVRVFLVGRNLFTITKYRGFDPEIDTNVASANYPNTRQYSAGIEFTF